MSWAWTKPDIPPKKIRTNKREEITPIRIVFSDTKYFIIIICLLYKTAGYKNLRGDKGSLLSLFGIPIVVDVTKSYKGRSEKFGCEYTVSK
jgi:hypothetical protein